MLNPLTDFTPCERCGNAAMQNQPQYLTLGRSQRGLMRDMNITSRQQSDTTPKLRWWTLLFVLALGMPQCSLLVTKLMRIVSLHSNLSRTVDMAVSFALFGASTAFSISSSVVILACIMLMGGSHLKRMGIALGYIVCTISVNFFVLVFFKYALQQFVMANGADFPRLIVHLLMPLLTAVAPLPFAAAIQFHRGWTIVPRGAPPVARRIDLLTLLEWVLISAILFAFLRATFSLKYLPSQVVVFYEMLMVLVPTIGIGFATIYLLRWILATGDFRPRQKTAHDRTNATKTFIRIALVHASVYVIVFAALDWHDRGIAMQVNMRSAIAPLATCVVGTINAAAILFCLRKLGYRIVTYATIASDPTAA